MPEFSEESDEKFYTLSRESLAKLLQQSFRNGVVSGYQSLYDSLEMNVKDEQFQGNEDMLYGFNFCKNIIGTMVNVADKTFNQGRGNDV